MRDLRTVWWAPLTSEHSKVVRDIGKRLLLVRTQLYTVVIRADSGNERFVVAEIVDKVASVAAPFTKFQNGSVVVRWRGQLGQHLVVATGLRCLTGYQEQDT